MSVYSVSSWQSYPIAMYNADANLAAFPSKLTPSTRKYLKPETKLRPTSSTFCMIASPTLQLLHQPQPSSPIRCELFSKIDPVCSIVKKMPANFSLFAESKIPQQKNYGGIVFPAVVSPAAVQDYDPSDFPAAVKDQKPWLDPLLHTHGAILFRGFNSSATAPYFNDVVEAFGYEELPYVGGAAPRTVVVGRVFTANESPPDQKIPFHHEMAQVPEYPLKLFFFCEVEPAEGGETPIVLSHIVYERIKEKHPEFVVKLEKHGVIYMRVLGEEDDPSSPIGRGWKSTFLTDDKSVAEEKAAKLNMKLEWMNDGVKSIMGPIPAIKYDESRQRKIWFNSMVAAYTGWEDKRNDPKKAVTFGDGSPLPEDIVLDCLRILEEESISIPWRKGDIILIDNLAVLHSRKPFTPPRRILASLCK